MFLSCFCFVLFCLCVVRYIHHAIKEKVVSLPLPQLVDIDAQRKAERVEREALVAKGKSLGLSNGSGSSIFNREGL